MFIYMFKGAYVDLTWLRDFEGLIPIDVSR